MEYKIGDYFYSSFYETKEINFWKIVNINNGEGIVYDKKDGKPYAVDKLRMVNLYTNEEMSIETRSVFFEKFKWFKLIVKHEKKYWHDIIRKFFEYKVA